jgi:hypothetical protein
MDLQPRRQREEIYIANGIQFIVYSDSSSDDEHPRLLNFELFYQEILPKTQGLSNEDLNKLGESSWKNEFSLEEANSNALVLRKKTVLCSICLTGIQQGELVRKLNCSHFFHRECIDGWLKLKGVCPLDRKKV